LQLQQLCVFVLCMQLQQLCVCLCFVCSCSSCVCLCFVCSCSSLVCVCASYAAAAALCVFVLCMQQQQLCVRLCFVCSCSCSSCVHPCSVCPPPSGNAQPSSVIRVGQNRTSAPYMTVCMVISLPKKTYVHCVNL